MHFQVKIVSVLCTRTLHERPQNMKKQDYILNQINETVALLLQLFFNIKSATTEDIRLRQDSSEELDWLKWLVDDGMIDEAEDRVFDLPNSLEDLKLALLFYSYLNTKEDEFLEANDFSRDEIEIGLKDLGFKYGFSDTASFFLD